MTEYECGNENCGVVIKADKEPYCCPKCGTMFFTVIDEPLSAWDEFQMVGR